MNPRLKKILPLGLIVLAIACLLYIPDRPRLSYHKDKGRIFGTYYSIQYEACDEWGDSLVMVMQQVDSTLSMFNPQSLLSRINRGEEVETTPMLERVYATAQEVNSLSFGAFDITVAPLVNYWGFGTDHEADRTHADADVAAIMPYIGQQLTDLHEHRLYRFDERIQLDMSAIAKGFACDEVARYLQDHGVENYLVDIGGEIVARGHKRNGQPWCVGITKPADDPEALEQELQDTLYTTSIAMATSGNYRRFYYEGEQKRSHTIDPRTGYPVQHNLLSATVTAESCMKADALATACMVLGERDALELISRVPDAACYLIVGDEDQMRVSTSANWTKR